MSTTYGGGIPVEAIPIGFLIMVAFCIWLFRWSQR